MHPTIQTVVGGLRRNLNKLRPSERKNRKIKQLQRDRDWVALERHFAAIGHTSSRLARHAAHCAAALPNLQRIHADRHAHQERLRAAVTPDLTIRDVARAEVPGAIAVDYSIVTADTADGDLEIFEKNYAPERLATAKREIALHASGLAQSLYAPKLLGHAFGGGVVSLYFEYLRGFEPAAGDTLKFQPVLLLAQWASRPGDDLRTIAPSDPIERLLRPEGPAWRQIAGAATHAELQTERGRALILDTYRALPQCVVNTDLTAGNVGTARGRPYIVDWDKWTIARCGVGLQLPENAAASGPISEFLSSAATALGVSRPSLETAALLDSIRHHMRLDRPLPTWLISSLWTNVRNAHPSLSS